MTYAQWITKMRNQTGDLRRRVHVDWTANGTDTVFNMPLDTFPVLDQAGTYIVKVATVTKTEVTDFTLDKETGTLVFLVAPTVGQAVTIDSSAVYITDDGCVNITNDVINSLGDDFFYEFVDDSGVTTTANMLTASLAVAQPNCIAVYDWSYRQSSVEDWSPVENFCNWRYSREDNKLYLSTRTAFTVAGQPMKIRGLKTFTQGSTVSATLDVQTRYLTVLEYGFLARYYAWQYKRVIESISKNTTENTRTPLQEFMMLVDRFDRLFEKEKARLKPMKPARMIPVFKEGFGRP